MLKKLTLKQETVFTLRSDELDRVVGGAGEIATGTASSVCPPGTFGKVTEFLATATASSICPAGTFGKVGKIRRHKL